LFGYKQTGYHEETEARDSNGQKSRAVQQGKERARKQYSFDAVEGLLIQEELLAGCGDGRLEPIICSWFVLHRIRLDPPVTIVGLVKNRTLIC